jgi:hypothetical protein
MDCQDSQPEPAAALLLAHPVVRALSEKARTAWCRLYARAKRLPDRRVIDARGFALAPGGIHLPPAHPLTRQVVAELLDASLIVPFEGAHLVHDGAGAEDARAFAAILSHMPA